MTWKPSPGGVLELDSVSGGYDGSPVVRGVSLRVEAGESVAVLGASGSGKTTMLRMIAGLHPVSSGRILLDGRRIDRLSAQRRGIGLVPQQGALFPHLDVAHNVGFGLVPPGPLARWRGRAERAERVREVLDLVRLADRAGDRPSQLSGGQQQRVALARALAPGAGLILLDEPFSALDAGLRAQTREATIDILERARVTTLLVTHDQDEALSFGDLIGVVADGRLAQHGEPSAVFDDPVDLATADFLGDTLTLRARRQGEGTVTCGLGSLAVRHDRTEGAADVVAMLRPSQLEIVAQAGHEPGRATISARRAIGSRTELRVDIHGEDAARVWLQVPTHRAGELKDGDQVAVRAGGGVVLYPAP